MNVLQINTVFKQGSTGYIVYNIHQKLLSLNHKSFAGYGRGIWQEDNLIKISNKLDMYIHGIGTRIFDKHGLYSKKATQEFLKKIDKLDIDIFHLHNIHGYYLNYPLLFEYLKNKQKPVIWTLHDCWAFTGHCSHYDYIGCDKWQNECYKCPQKSRYPASFIFDNSLENFRLKKKYFTSLDNLIIVTPSNWLANEVQKSFLAKYDIRVIYNGIDLNVFKPVKSDFRKKYNLEDKFLILGVANVWEERKGFDYFIELSHILKSNEVIILVGLNDKQLQKLPKNIIGIKRTQNQKELVQIYSNVDVFVNPTLEDNFPTTNLESLACGTPVVTFDSGGSSETIDENCGKVVEKGDLDKLYKAIGEVKKNGKDFYRNHCIDRAKKYFDKEMMIEKYVKLYKEIV